MFIKKELPIDEPQLVEANGKDTDAYHAVNYQKLDNETVSLEESLDLYQRGMKLSAACDTTLKNAEKKVNDLIKEEAEDEKNDESTDE